MDFAAEPCWTQMKISGAPGLVFKPGEGIRQRSLPTSLHFFWMNERIVIFFQPETVIFFFWAFIKRIAWVKPHVFFVFFNFDDGYLLKRSYRRHCIPAWMFFFSKVSSTHFSGQFNSVFPCGKSRDFQPIWESWIHTGQWTSSPDLCNEMCIAAKRPLPPVSQQKRTSTNQNGVVSECLDWSSKHDWLRIVC